MINPEELVLKERSKTLSDKEKSIAAMLEEFIDQEIRESFNNGEAYVEKFEYKRSKLKEYCELKTVRQQIVKAVVFELYRDNGWKITLKAGEDDGPNRPGIDYWIFEPK